MSPPIYSAHIVTGQSGSGMESLFVEAYPGYKGELTPRAFIHDGIRRDVAELLDRWYREEMTYFRVCADDGHRYVLRYDQERVRWELVMQEE